LRKKANRALNFVVVLLVIGFSVAAFAGEVTFFGEGIDYWNDKAKTVAPAPEASVSPPPSAPTSTAESIKQAEAAGTEQKPQEGPVEKFDWQPFLDAKSKEFFREGDYTPPEPFMEIVRNPSDANLRMWFAYIERKNALTQRLAERMNEYVRKNGGAMPAEARAHVQTVASKLPTVARDYRSLRFRMYFDSTCPHCKKMFQTLNELQSRGYFVEARQVDQGPTQHLGSEVPIVPASKDELKKFGVNSVPLTLIGDLGTGTVFRHSGFQSADDLFGSLFRRRGGSMRQQRRRRRQYQTAGNQ
jgi:thiol-disulfide isomerase/thioredoxin